jgi:hypothetical protein
MNGRVSKLIRLMTIGGHSIAVMERSSREYKLHRSKYHQVLLAKGSRRLYQEGKSAFKSDDRPQKIKVRKLVEFCAKHKELLLVRPSVDFGFYSAQQGKLPNFIKPSLLG